MERPNIVFIMSDEHDPAVTGCYGDPLVETPNLDRLAQRGVTFDACYCNSPLCVPSRLSFTAGKYIHRVGAWSNNCWLPSDDMPSLPSVLREAGYEPYLCGKQHYDAERRYGFIDLWPEANPHRKTGFGGRRDPESTHVDHNSWEQRSSQFYAGDESGILNHDRKVTEVATKFLRERERQSAPYFLFVGYLSPHFPLIAPEEIYAKYKDKVPAANIPEGLLENLPRNYQHLRRGFAITDATQDIERKGRDLYWALTDWFDGQIGELLSVLEETHDLENTIIVYTSDHGENKGDHGLWWKNCHYEHGSRVPLIVSWPAKWAGGQRRSQVCSLVDVVQTVAEIAGGKVPGDWDGDSLCGVLDDGFATWKDFAVSQYYGHNIASGTNMLRQGEYKYIYHNACNEKHGAERELFNLNDDPEEFTNLANNPAYADRVASMHEALVAELGEDPDAIETRCLEEYAKGYGR